MGWDQHVTNYHKFATAILLQAIHVKMGPWAPPKRFGSGHGHFGSRIINREQSNGCATLRNHFATETSDECFISLASQESLTSSSTSVFTFYSSRNTKTNKINNYGWSHSLRLSTVRFVFAGGLSLWICSLMRHLSVEVFSPCSATVAGRKTITILVMFFITVLDTF